LNVIIETDRKSPRLSNLTFRFFKAVESPPITLGAFHRRNNRKMDRASRVTNDLCLAPSLLDPTNRYLPVFYTLRCLATALACSHGVQGTCDPRTSLLSVSDVRNSRIHKILCPSLGTILKRALKDAPSASRLL
jgi:hypothetical protein